MNLVRLTVVENEVACFIHGEASLVHSIDGAAIEHALHRKLWRPRISAVSSALSDEQAGLLQRFGCMHDRSRMDQCA